MNEQSCNRLIETLKKLDFFFDNGWVFWLRFSREKYYVFSTNGEVYFSAFPALFQENVEFDDLEWNVFLDSIKGKKYRNLQSRIKTPDIENWVKGLLKGWE